MTTISNNKLPEWRKTLNKSVENYQSMRAWYEENPDNPSAEQDMDAAAGEIEKLIKQYGVLIVLNLLDEIDELQERRKAERGSEPVAWTDAEELSDLKRDGYAAMLSLDRKDCEHADPRRQILLFTHPAPARQRDQIRREHAEWSDATFGDVGPIGPLKHLSEEALEAAAEPEDLSEWADMQFLLWDAQRRAGISDEQITQAMVEKLAVNKQREWPEPKDGEPRLHIKEQPAPVVPDGLRQALSNAGIAAPESDEMLAATCEKYIQMLVTWVKDRKPFQPVPVVPEKMSKHALFEVAIARFSKMSEGFPSKRFKADWVISWMLENFPPVAQKQGDN